MLRFLEDVAVFISQLQRRSLQREETTATYLNRQLHKCMTHSKYWKVRSLEERFFSKNMETSRGTLGSK